MILCLTPLATVGAGAVTYPDGVEQADAVAAIPKINVLVKTLMKTALPGGDLKTTVYKTICTDSTINSVFASVYGAISENADSLSVIGIKLTPSTLSNALSAYPDVSKKLASCKTLKECIEKSKTFKWHVTTKEGFSTAFAAMLSPFNPLLYTVLCSGTIKINNFLSIKGADGYTNSVIPLLRAMGCPGIMTSESFKADANTAKSRMIKNIMKMVFASLDKLLDDPVIGATSTLPGLAYYLDSGKLSAAIKSLLEPLSLKIAGIFTIPGISDLITKAADLEDGIDINNVINKISEQAGQGSGFTIPEIDIKALAACGTPTDNGFVADEPAALITVLRWAIEAVRLNSSKLATQGANGESPLDALFKKSNDEIIKIIISLLNISAEAPANDYQWVYPPMTQSSIEYTANLGAEQYTEVVEKFDPLLTDFVKEEDPEGTIEDVISKKIYSNSTLTSIVKSIFSVLSSKELAGMAGLAGIPVYPRSVGDSISRLYPSAAKVLYRHNSWETLSPNSVYWGFKDGNREGFEKALTKVLSPMTPLLSCLLAGNQYSLLGAVTIPGADGYNTVIIPLLEALGCSSDSIKTYEEYKERASGSAALTDILDPIFGLLDEICSSPIKTICRILPNIVYFIDNGLMNVCIENLLYPIRFMLKTTGMEDLFAETMNTLPALDLNAEAKKLLESSDMKLKLPDPDIKKLGTLGTPITMTSKRTVSGSPAQYTYITADSPAVMLTLLRYLVGALSMEENAPMLKGFMESMTGPEEPSEDGIPDMTSMFVANMSEKFKDMTVDEIIEWFYDLLFRETPPVPDHEAEAEIPTIIYEEEFHVPGWAIFLVILVFFISAGAALLYLYKKGKLDKAIEKHQKKRDEKQRKAEHERLIAAKIKSGELKETELEKKPKKQKKQKKQKPVHKGKTKKEKPQVNPYASKESQKLEKRRRKAEIRSEKNELKSQKHYEKAVREAEKKKLSGRDKN